MESHALDTPPLPNAQQAARPVVDLRPCIVDGTVVHADGGVHADHAGGGVHADHADPWEWGCEVARRIVAGDDDRMRRRVVEDTIKGPDRHRGADRHQLDTTLDALDRGQPVVMSSWWPAAPSDTDILGVATLTSPAPGGAGPGLVAGHVVVIVGYGRHGAFPGGGYLIVLDQTGCGTAGATRNVAFAHVLTNAIALRTPRVVRAQLRPVRPPDDPVDEGGALPPLLLIGRSQHPADAEIARKARCADPRSSYTALFFSENVMDTARAKAICARCAVRDLCLARALERAEPYGVWGGQFLIDGEVVVAKRGRGRPRRIPLPTDVDEITGMPVVA